MTATPRRSKLTFKKSTTSKLKTTLSPLTTSKKTISKSTISRLKMTLGKSMTRQIKKRLKERATLRRMRLERQLGMRNQELGMIQKKLPKRIRLRMFFCLIMNLPLQKKLSRPLKLSTRRKLKLLPSKITLTQQTKTRRK